MTFILIGAFCMFVILFLFIPIFAIWVTTQAIQARKYRSLQLGAEPPSNGPAAGWEVIYKEGRKQHTVLVQGDTEGDAMKELMKMSGVRYDAVLSITRKG